VRGTPGSANVLSMDMENNEPAKNKEERNTPPAQIVDCAQAVRESPHVDVTEHDRKRSEPTS